MIRWLLSKLRRAPGAPTILSGGPLHFTDDVPGLPICGARRTERTTRVFNASVTCEVCREMGLIAEVVRATRLR